MHCAVLYCTVQYSTVQYSAYRLVGSHSTVTVNCTTQYSAGQNNTACRGKSVQSMFGVELREVYGRIVAAEMKPVPENRPKSTAKEAGTKDAAPTCPLLQVLQCIFCRVL